MAYKLHKSGVITGSVNSFCLGCDEFLKSEHEADDHVVTSPHINKLSVVQYSEKFKGEHIRKFKWGYYCEFCNVMLQIASKVNLHVTEEEHLQNKGVLLLETSSDNALTFDDVRIEEKAWHGMKDGVCSVCNIEFFDEKAHKSDASHSLKIVLKPVKFGANDAIYRVIDESAVHCLTCNEPVAPSKMNDHFNDTNHQALYSKLRLEISEAIQIEASKTSAVENDREIMESKVDNDNDCKNNKNSSAKQKSKILESLDRYQRDGININLETDTALCKKCSEVIPLEVMEIENHIKNHSSTEKVDSELLYPSNLDQDFNRVNINDKSTKVSEDLKRDLKDTFGAENSLDDEATDPCFSSAECPDNKNEKCTQAEAKAFAKKNQISYNKDNDQSYCRVCEVKLPSPLRSMKEHVAGATHKKKAKSLKPNTVFPMIKQETRYFIDSAYEVEGHFWEDMIINNEFCIPRLSFWLITKNNSRLRCILCETTLSQYSDDLSSHLKSEEHTFKHVTTPVIISEKSEFIREIRSDLYHCGYCNLVVSGWDKMKQHLQCTEHKENRKSGDQRLENHLPDLQQYKMMKNMETLRMMWLLNRLG